MKKIYQEKRTYPKSLIFLACRLSAIGGPGGRQVLSYLIFPIFLELLNLSNLGFAHLDLPNAV